ncbi:MAG TPA: GxxExxY protein, partial [Pyrinomonadaceae bacterium]|nr:GxxExxY protein [Pyrinomonadaceae bacterium]
TSAARVKSGVLDGDLAPGTDLQDHWGLLRGLQRTGTRILESVYQKSLGLALQAAGLEIRWPVSIPVWFRGHQVGHFEGDMLVQSCVLLELKAVRALDSSHQAQLLNYLRATEIEVGLLLNFGVRPEFKRLLFDNPRKLAR